MKELVRNISTFILLIVLFFVLAGCQEQNKPVTGFETGYYLNHNDTVQYVGMKVCAECHVHEYQSYIQTGMGQSFDFATKEKSASAIHVDSLIYDEVLDLYLQPFWDADTMKVREFRLSNQDTVYNRVERVDYVVGSGQHTNSHMYSVNGYVFQIPFTYYTQDGMFDAPPGFEGGHNTRFVRKIGLECMSCHNGFPEMVLGSENKYTHIPQGIDCERCHGPGEIHVQLKKSGVVIDTSKYIDYSIVNPAKLDFQLQIDLCARCHLQGTMVLKENKSFYDYKPGMPLTEVMDIFMPLYEGGKEDFIMASHYERFTQSKCYLSSKEVFNCQTCHDPHVSKTVTSFDKYNNECMNCHNPDGFYCSEEETNRRVHNNSCVECHMPESLTRDIPHVRIHDHKIRIPETPEELLSPRVFKGLVAVNNMDTDSLTIARGYIKEFETYQPNPAYLDSARMYLNDYKALNNGFYFNALINLYFQKEDFNSLIQLVEKTGIQKVIGEYLVDKDFSNYDAWTAYRIAQSYENAENQMIAKYFYEKSIELAGLNLEFRMNYGSLLTKMSKLNEAKQVFEFIITENPQMASAHINLGYIYVSFRQNEKALEQYKKALALDPDNMIGLFNIAGLYYKMKDKDQSLFYINRVLELDRNNKQALSLKRQLLK